MSNDRHKNGKKTAGTRGPKGTAMKQGGIKKSRAAKQPKKDKYHIRRILAERPATATQGGKAYLIDWFPTWEPAVHLKNEGQIKGEWEINRESYTFKFGNKRVAKCENPTSDESEEQCRLMFDTVANELQDWLVVRGPKEVAQDLFVEEEWIFAYNDEKIEAFKEAAEARDPEPTAAGVMRQTYIAMREGNVMPDGDLSDLAYRNICVRYLGQIDDKLPSVSGPHQRSFAKVKNWLFPLCHPALRTMKVERWEKEVEMHAKLKELDEVVRSFVTRSPFLLKKTHVWPLFFTRLFLKSDEIEGMLKMIGKLDGTSQQRIRPDITLNENWPEETRDWFLQAYSATFDWEPRAVENIERTYLYCRDLVQDRVMRVPKPQTRRNKLRKGAKADKAVMSATRQPEEPGSEDDPEQDEAYEPGPDGTIMDD